MNAAREIAEACAGFEVELDALATYNSECHRGIVHTADYDAQMTALQDRFDALMTKWRDRS